MKRMRVMIKNRWENIRDRMLTKDSEVQASSFIEEVLVFLRDKRV